MTTDPTTQQGRAEGEDEIEAVVQAFIHHYPEQLGCDPGGLVCSNPEHLAVEILASDWFAARVAAARAEALQEAADALSRGWGPNIFEGADERYAEWLLARAVVSREPGEGDTA